MFLDSEVKKAIKSAKVVSFDIFDTLLLRPFLLPTDAFEVLEKKENLAGFSALRQAAEPKAWKGLVCELKDDVTLDEIYQEMPDEIQFMKEKEIAFESTHLLANPEMLEVLQYALSEGKKIIITSDMYLPPDALRKVLINQLKTEEFELYVSAPLGMRKATGRLYDFILTDLQIKPSEMVHIGDNKTSDYRIPKEKGIQAFYYLKPSDALLHDSHVSTFYNTHNTYEGRTFLAILSLLYQYAKKKINSEYWKRFAFLYGGPVVYTYMQFAIKKAKELGLTDLAFVARDGYSFEKVFNLINKDENLKARYTYAPRFTNLLSYLDFGPSFIVAERRKILSEFLKEQGVPINSADDLEKFDAELKNFSQLERSEYEKYIASLNFGKKIGVVDSLSLSFSAQRLIAKSVKDSEVVGIYWHYDPLTDSVLPKEAYDTNAAWPMFSDILELLMAAPESPIQRIKDCKPIYKKPISKYEQIKIDLYPTLSEMIVEFARLVKELSLGIPVSSQMMVDWMNSFVAGANKEDFKKFKNIKNSKDQGHNIYHSILTRTSDNSPFYKRKKFIDFIYQKRINTKGVLKIKIFRIPVYAKRIK
ncbi:MAG: hypothetical protein J6Y03_02370 [Alphaproteobacteria bacterium]|nr:hypothetical protein [Alphaproteobacteria bacterium]